MFKFHSHITRENPNEISGIYDVYFAQEVAP
jgi:hypothetical protein